MLLNTKISKNDKKLLQNANQHANMSPTENEGEGTPWKNREIS